jgi:hypothetical protein
MRMTRSLFLVAAVLLPAMHATAVVLGPRFEAPVEWVFVFDPRTRALVKVSSLLEFAVASNGTDFFVAWRQRALVGTVGPAGEPPRRTRGGVFGVRIDAAGNVLDAAPIQLPVPGGDTCDFRVTSCPAPSALNMSTGWVAFAPSSDSYMVCNGGCARVDSCGTLLDANPIPFSGSVLSDGQDHFLLLGGQLFFVDSDGTLVAHPFAAPIGSVASDSDGGHFLSVTGSEITLFDSNGATLNATPMPFQTSQPAVTFDGDKYLIFWAGSGPGGRGKYVTRVSSDGEPLDTSARLALSADPFGTDRTYRISFDGMNAVAAWCSTCLFDGNGAPIAVIQQDDQADGQIIATLVGATGPMRSGSSGLAIASNSTGVSVVIADGFSLWLPSPVLGSFFPVVQFVTTWAPSPERNERSDRRPWCQRARRTDDRDAGSKHRQNLDGSRR